MKYLKKCLKPISLLLALTILLQGCTVYKKQNITLEQAVTMQGVKVKKKVKVLTTDNETQKYLYVTSINDEYYGIKKGGDGLTKVLLQEENLKKVNIQDRAATIALGLLYVLGVTAIVSGVAFAISEGGMGF